MTAEDDRADDHNLPTNADTGRCGSTDTSSGEPCERGPNCPYHQQEDPPETGRPTKLTHERQERIAGLLEGGHSIAAACRTTGISRETYHDWVRRGEEQEEGIFADFADRVGRARGVGERRIIEDAREAAREAKNANALLRMAQLQYPESWGDEMAGAVNTAAEAPRERRETDHYVLLTDAEAEAEGLVEPDGDAQPRPEDDR